MIRLQKALNVLDVVCPDNEYRSKAAMYRWWSGSIESKQRYKSALSEFLNDLADTLGKGEFTDGQEETS